MFRLSTALLFSIAAAGLVACNGNDATGPDQAAPTVAELDGGQSDSSAPADSPVLAATRLPKSFFINPISGSDANPGTKLKPFKTLAKGLGLAISGDTMRLASGVYSAATGEKFTNANQQVTVPAGVKILGTYAEDFTSQLHGVAGETGLKLLGSATVRDLILTGFTVGIQASQGVQNLKGLYFNKNSTGLELEGTAQATLVKSSVFLSPGGAFPEVKGANVVDQAWLTVDGGTITGGAPNCNFDVAGVTLHEAGRLTAKNGATFKEIAGVAVYLAEASKATLTSLTTIDRDFSQFPGCAPLPSLVASEGSSLTLNNARVFGKGGTKEIGIDARSQAALTITGSKLSGHTFAAVHLFDKQKLVVSGSTFSGNLAGIHGLDAQTVTLTVTGSTLTGNLAGIVAPSLKLRGSTVTGNAIGVGITGSTADVGKLAYPGNNVFSGNSQTGVQFYAGQAVSSGTIYAAGNTWNAGIQDADGSGHYPKDPLVNGSSAKASGQNFKLPDGNANFKIQL